MVNTVNMMSDESINLNKRIREALAGKENCSSIRIHDYIVNKMRHRIEFSCVTSVKENDIIYALDYIMKNTRYHKNKELLKDFIEKAEALVSAYNEEEMTDIGLSEIQTAFYISLGIYDCWLYCQEQNYSITTKLSVLKSYIK